MGRRDFVFKWLFYALTALGFVLVQVFGLVHIRIWGVHPFLFPVLVSTVAALCLLWPPARCWMSPCRG